MYCVMRASVPSLHNVYRRYDMSQHIDIVFLPYIHTYALPLLARTAPSAPPTSVSVSEVTSSSITVQWRPVDCIHRNGDITGYSVQYGSETVSVSGDSSGGMYVISGLMPSTTYSIQVAAENSAGTGPYSTSLHNLTAGRTNFVPCVFPSFINSQLKLQL